MGTSGTTVDMLNTIPIHLSEVLAVRVLVPTATKSRSCDLSAKRAVPIVVLYITPKLQKLLIHNSQFFLQMCGFLHFAIPSTLKIIHLLLKLFDLAQ